MTDRPLNWKLNLFVIWLTQIMCVAGFSLIIPFVPIYIRDTWGVSDESVLGAWMAAFTFFGMLSYCVFTPVWGILADRYGRKLMLLRAYYLDGLIFPCFLLAPSPFWLIVARFVVSAFTGTVSAAQTLIVTTTPEKESGIRSRGALVGYLERQPGRLRRRGADCPPVRLYDRLFALRGDVPCRGSPGAPVRS